MSPKYRDLNAPPKQQMADVVRQLKDRAQSSKTGAHGEKHMGENGNSTWTRPDGAERSVREVDGDLDLAQGRIDEAVEELEQTRIRVEEAKQAVADAQGRLDQVEDEDLPAVRRELAAAAQDAADALGELDDRLDNIATDEALAGIRDDLAAAQGVAESARSVATEANTAANAASQAALEAAGIAASKGRVIVQETEPTDEDRQSSNIWIQPVPDDPDTEIVEKAVTYVYLEATDEWQPTTSSELAQAAQNALDAREAAQQAQQRADTAVSNAATAQAAAEAAQTTANTATLDAAEAHNAAVAAQEGVDAAIERGDSLLINGSFEQGDLGWPTGGSHGGRSRIIEDPAARTGKNVLELAPTTANVYPESDFIAVEPGQILRVRGWFKHLGGNGTRVGLLVRHHDANKSYLRVLYATVNTTVQTWTIGEWTLLEGEIQVPSDVRWFRFAFHATGPSTSTYHADDYQVVDVTEARTAQAAAEAARALAASKPGMTEVETSIKTSANGKNAITISAAAPTSSTPGVVVGDTWWRVDGSGQIFGQWRWTSLPAGWVPASIRSEVIANLDVGKLVVTGTSRFTEAVIDRLFADLFVAHKITAEQITIAALDEDGNLAEGSVLAVTIKDGAVSTPKLNVTEEMAAKIASFMSVETKELIVTESAILQHATLLGQTVVEQINILDKLIGVDGVFTGMVDFANINVTGEAILAKLATNSISADLINVTDLAALLVTAGLIRTGTSGRRIVIAPAGIQGYNAAGQRSISIDGENNFFAGRISTARDGQPGIILAPLSAGGGGLFFSQDGSASGDQAAIFSYLDGNIRIRPKSSLPRGTVFIDGNLVVDSKTDFNGAVTATALVSSGNGIIRNRLSVDEYIFNPGRPTTTNPANVYMNPSTGLFALMMSSRRYKKNIEDWAPAAEQVLGLRPRIWQNSDPENMDPEGSWHVGFIAEEVHDLGLRQLVQYGEDEDGNERPEALHYGVFAAAQQVVLKDHEERVSALEAENSTLRQQVAALTARLDAAGI